MVTVSEIVGILNTDSAISREIQNFYRRFPLLVWNDVWPFWKMVAVGVLHPKEVIRQV